MLPSAPPPHPLTTQEVISLTAVVLTAITAIATLLVALASARSAQSSAQSASVMEKMYRSSNTANLRLQYLIFNGYIFPDSLQPMSMELTPEFVAFRTAWRNANSAQSPQPWTKHAVFAMVTNLGPAPARNVILQGRLQIHQPNLSDFFKDVRYFTSGPNGIPILEVGRGAAVLIHVFDTPSPECRVRQDGVARLSYTTPGGESTEEISGGDFTYLVDSPIQASAT